MANGDRSQRIIARVRDRRNDNDKHLEKTDKEIYAKGSAWQAKICIEHLAIRVSRPYPLIKDQADYQLEQDVLQITSVKIQVPEEGECNCNNYWNWWPYPLDENRCFSAFMLLSQTTGEDIRKFSFKEKVAERFTDGLILLVDMYTKPINPDDNLSASVDPILEADWDDVLIDGILSDYREMDGRKDFPSREQVIRDIKSMRAAKAGLNRFNPHSHTGVKMSW